MSNRLDNTRVVIFTDDYNPAGNGVIYEKGIKHYIHKSTVEMLEKRGVKLKATEFNEKAEVEKAKKVIEDSKKD